MSCSEDGGVIRDGSFRCGLAWEPSGTLGARATLTGGGVLTVAISFQPKR